jgi:hypothetical protein
MLYPRTRQKPTKPTAPNTANITTAPVTGLSGLTKKPTTSRKQIKPIINIHIMDSRYGSVKPLNSKNSEVLLIPSYPI